MAWKDKKSDDNKWNPKIDKKYDISSSLYGGTYKMEIYFLYNRKSLLVTTIGHEGDLSATVKYKDNIYTINNEEIDISDLNSYMIEEVKKELEPEEDYSVKFPPIEE